MAVKKFLKILLRLIFIIISLLGFFSYFIFYKNYGFSYFDIFLLVSILILLLFGLFFKMKFLKGDFMIIKIIFMFLILFVSLTYTIFYIDFNFSKKNYPEENQDLLIILGAGLVHGTELSDSLRYRCLSALDYLNANPNTIIIATGGKGSDEKITEASAIKNFLIQNGIEEKRILLEDKSTSTLENLIFSKIISDNYFAEKSPSTIIVTNNFHVRRGILYASYAGFKNVSGIYSKNAIFNFKYYLFREYFGLLKFFIIDKPILFFKSLK